MSDHLFSSRSFFCMHSHVVIALNPKSELPLSLNHFIVDRFILVIFLGVFDEILDVAAATGKK